MTLGLNKHPIYIELLQAFPPRPIKTEKELFATQKIIDSLIDSAPLTSDEKDYLNILGTLVYEYEQTQQPVPDIYGVDLLQVLIEENGLLQKDLVPIFKTESIISAILKKRRKLTTRHIEELADFFQISPAAFFPNSLE
ncbi:MAG: transcriptional regulator [Nostoc sp.]|uniref:helix-turn-helix domain-containing protein n=1 Tax=Nostoc sp. TaxID=1180 RepID=UPI002FFAD84C